MNTEDKKQFKSTLELIADIALRSSERIDYLQPGTSSQLKEIKAPLEVNIKELRRIIIKTKRHEQSQNMRRDFRSSITGRATSIAYKWDWKS